MRELTAEEDTLIRKSLVASGKPIDGPKEMWLAERAVLVRRIKNQRRELRRLNAQARGLDMLVRNMFNRETTSKINAYRHAARLAETFWFGGRIANQLRKWY